ncbi:MAG: transcription antitermination factor NusB [Clostridia bacterium]|nr:transcription antitermination factor NusB [Clostridia bacterium]
MRKDAREAVYRMLYSYFLTGEIDGETKDFYLKEHKLTDKDVEFADALISAVLERENDLRDELASIAVSYSVDRINYLDKAALYLALAEINGFDDIDYAVSVDEAVRLVKKYSTENSLSFVNGVLAEAIRRKTNENN